MRDKEAVSPKLILSYLLRKTSIDVLSQKTDRIWRKFFVRDKEAASPKLILSYILTKNSPLLSREEFFIVTICNDQLAKSLSIKACVNGAFFFSSSRVVELYRYMLAASAKYSAG